MKRFYLLFCLIITTSIRGQVTGPGDITLGIGNGLCVFHQETSDTAGYYNRDTVGGINVIFHGEYSLSSHFGIAASYSYSGLFSETFLLDAECSMTEIGIGLNAHLGCLNNWIDLQGELGGGYARYHYVLHNAITPQSNYSNVLVYGEFHPQIFFTVNHHWGAFPYYRFSMQFGGGYKRNATSPTHYYDVQTIGHSFGIGFFYRFGTSKNKLNPTNP